MFVAFGWSSSCLLHICQKAPVSQAPVHCPDHLHHRIKNGATGASFRRTCFALCFVPSTSEPGARPRSPEQRPRRCGGRDQNISRREKSRRATGYGAVRRNFSNRGPQAGADGEESADGGKCDGGAVGVRVGNGTPYRARCVGVPAVGAGGNRYAVQRARRWVNRVKVRWNPQFCSTAPPGTPIPPVHSFPCGPARKLLTLCSSKLQIRGITALWFLFQQSHMLLRTTGSQAVSAFLAFLFQVCRFWESFMHVHARRREMP